MTTGSLARVIGPIAVAEIYEQWGTYVLFITVTATLVVSLVFTLVFWRQLITKVAQAKSDGGIGSKAKPDSGIGSNQAEKDEDSQLREEDESNGME